MAQPLPAFLPETLQFIGIDPVLEEELAQLGGAIWVDALRSSSEELQKWTGDLNSSSFTKEEERLFWDKTKLDVIERVETRCKELQEALWENLHFGDWKDVSEGWRDLYSLTHLLFASCKFLRSLKSPQQTFDDEKQAIKLLDMALIMGSPKEAIRTQINSFLGSISSHIPKDQLEEKQGDKATNSKRKAGEENPKSNQDNKKVKVGEDEGAKEDKVKEGEAQKDDVK